MATEQERFARWARSADGADPVPIVAAATVVLLRDTERGLETLMLRRDSRLAFAGGMWVFPGGRVDPGDFAGDETDDATAGRNAAVREAAEEAGLVVDAGLARPVRALDAAAGGAEAVLDPVLRRARRRPARSRSTTARSATTCGSRPPRRCARRDALEIELAPPTWVTLHTLAEHATVAAAIDAARPLRARALHDEGRVHRRGRRRCCGTATPATRTATRPGKAPGTASGWSTPAGATSARSRRSPAANCYERRSRAAAGRHEA